MPSPQVVAREPGRRIKKSKKAERRAKQPVDLGDVDMETPTPSHQSSRAGPGAGAGRERSRRASERMPKAQGAKAPAKSRAGNMLDKGIAKRNAKQAMQLTAGRKTNGTAKKNRRAERAAPSPEAAPTQKQVLKGKSPAKRKLRDEGVDHA